jgi:hypothetical protein
MNRRKGLGAILAELNEQFLPEPYAAARAQTPVTRAQTRAYGRETLAPAGDRAYSAFGRTNSKGDRAGQDFRTFVKRDAKGDVYRYHEYNQGGKRRVLRVGGPMK